MTQPASGSDHSSVPDDALAPLAARDTQRLAARMVQDAFARVFRLAVGEEEEARRSGVAKIEEGLRNWAAAAEGEEARALRLALLVSGLDSWGLAYSQAFDLVAISPLSELVAALRTGLDAEDEARFLQQFDALGAAEANAIDFKVELRRGIHLALWHAMIAGDERAQAERILMLLGGMMLALIRDMPELGWRLVADALANIQIQCLAEGLATDGLAREMNEAFLGALARELPAELRDRVFAHAGRAVVDWHQARRTDQTRH